MPILEWDLHGEQIRQYFTWYSGTFLNGKIAGREIEM